MTKTVTPSDATPTLAEIWILRRLQKGSLRIDGVTAFQRGILTVMHERQWVTISTESRWELTRAGRAKMEMHDAPARR